MGLALVTVTFASPAEEMQRLQALRQKIALYAVMKNREDCEESLSAFFLHAWPYIDSAEYQPSWAIDAIADHLEAVTLGHIPRLLINVPPRCSKTTLCSIVYPAWTWARSEINFLSGPQVRFLCASYGHTLSLDSSNKSRRLLNSPWYQERWGSRFELRGDQNNKNQYDTTAGGSRISTSVGGTLLGLGGDILIADDLNKVASNKEQSESEAERETVRNFWNEFHSTRLNDPKRSAIIAIQQRLHRNDVSGLILDSGEAWTHLCIPMEYDASRTYYTVKLPQYDDDEVWNDPRTEEGELMWPERFGHAEVDKLKLALGPYMAAGRLQQRPRPKGGAIIEGDWWQPWDMVEARKYNLEWSGTRKEFPQCELVVASLDTSFGERQENDYNGFTVWGVWIDANKNRRAMLMYAWKKRLKLHGTVVAQLPGEPAVVYKERQKAAWGLVEWVADACRRYKVRRLLIENKTRGQDVANELNRLYARDNWGVQLLNPVGDKVSRVHSIVPLFTDNVVWAPDTKWAQEVILECEDFPKGDHDDLVDSASQFLNWARSNELLVRADEMSASMLDDAAYRPPVDSVASQYGV